MAQTGCGLTFNMRRNVVLPSALPAGFGAECSKAPVVIRHLAGEATNVTLQLVSFLLFFVLGQAGLFSSPHHLCFKYRNRR